jgi:hypothetical protein
MFDQPGNPYRPGAAISPLFLAGRGGEVGRFRSVMRGAPALPANIRLTGLRGVGKTVLLKEFEKVAVTELGWLATRYQLEPRHNREGELTDLLCGLADRARGEVSLGSQVAKAVKGASGAATRLLKVTYGEIEISLDPSGGARQRDLVAALFQAAETAYEHGRAGYLLLLDEAQVLRDDIDREGEHPLSLLIAAVNVLQEREVPIGIVLCGLPTLRTNLLRARTYSERMFRGEEIGRLGEVAATEAFVRPLDDTPMSARSDLITRVVDEVEGYPFFIQLWGAELFDAAQAAGISVFTGQLLDAVEVEIYRRLDIDFYDGRVESLTPAEQDLLMVTAKCSYPPLRTADVRAVSNKTEGNINVLMGRLVDQGVVYRIQKGVYEYTAPRFYEYLRRRNRT